MTVPSGTVTSLRNVTQSQYVTAVAGGSGVRVAGTGVLVAGIFKERVGVGDGALCVIAAIVCETIACSVAAESAWEGWPCWSMGMAKMETGKQAMMARAITPNKIRILLVVSFILHLQ
jgi:hypothetical protein